MVDEKVGDRGRTSCYSIPIARLPEPQTMCAPSPVLPNSASGEQSGKASGEGIEAKDREFTTIIGRYVVPMKANDIAVDVAASPFPFLMPPGQLHMTDNKVHPGDQESVWVTGWNMGGPSGQKETPSTIVRVLWLVFFPLILLWHSFRIYLLPCIQVYAERFFGSLCLTLGQTLCCMCTCKCWRQQEKCFLCEFEDGDFPPTSKSLGKWNGKSDSELDAIQWKRAAALNPGEKAALFQGGITPSDIAQGQLGDCWLMAALACLAEHPTAIMKCFITRERNVRGYYVIELYDARQAKFVRITLDDFLPTDNGQPLFAKPSGSELWVLLLEKAFAKFFGDYHALAGGHVAVAFEAMTGDNVMRFELEDGKWRKYMLVHVNNESSKRSVGLRKVVPEEAYSDADFFEILAVYDGVKSVMGAGSTQGRSDSAADSRNGICQGHAYSVIGTAKSGSFRMLKLRNPWGAFEWKGAWSDRSDLWDKNPAVAAKCGRENGAKDDGVFWMEMGDFVKNFDMIDICHRGSGLSDLKLSTFEEDGCIGPVKGCVMGCGSYYCCCQGPIALCCPKESTIETQRKQKCCPV